MEQKNGVPFLQVQFKAVDIGCDDISPKRLQHCRKWQLSEFMTPTEIVRTAFLAVRQAEIHECEENFKYMEVSIYNPHRDVEDLRMAVREDKRK